MLIPFLYPELFFLMTLFLQYMTWVRVGCMPNCQFMKNGVYGVRIVVTD